MLYERNVISLGVTAVCIRWDEAYLLGYRHLDQMMQERGVVIDHFSINRWTAWFFAQIELENINVQLVSSGEWIKPISIHVQAYFMNGRRTQSKDDVKKVKVSTVFYKVNATEQSNALFSVEAMSILIDQLRSHKYSWIFPRKVQAFPLALQYECRPIIH